MYTSDDAWVLRYLLPCAARADRGKDKDGPRSSLSREVWMAWPAKREITSSVGQSQPIARPSRMPSHAGPLFRGAWEGHVRHNHVARDGHPVLVVVTYYGMGGTWDLEGEGETGRGKLMVGELRDERR